MLFMWQQRVSCMSCVWLFLNAILFQIHSMRRNIEICIEVIYKYGFVYVRRNAPHCFSSELLYFVEEEKRKEQKQKYL